MHRILLPFLFILSLIACCIEVDISVPSFPDMTKYFNVSDGTIQLTIAYNFLGFCLASLFYGPLSDCFGRRNVMIIGNAFMLIGAFGCVFAASVPTLLLSRFIQGIGASTAAVVVFSMIADSYQGDKAVKLIAMMNSILTTLIAIAPVVGGFINEAVGWRGNYLIVAVISLIAWVSLIIWLPETKESREKFQLKKVLSDYRMLFMSSKFISTSIVPSLIYSAYLAFVSCASFLYMESFGLDIMTYSIHQGVIVAAFSFVSMFSGRIIEKFGERNCVIQGTALSMLGTVGMVFVSLISPNSYYLMTASMVIYCIGFAVVYPVIFAVSLEIFPDIKGTASSALVSMRALLCSVIVGIAGYLYNGQAISVALMVVAVVMIAAVFTFRIVRSDALATT